MRSQRLSITFVALLISCVMAAHACGLGQESEEDEAAKSLVRKGMLMMENVYLAIGSYEIDAHYLSGVESRLIFKEAFRHVVGLGVQPSMETAGSAAEGTVTYFGDDHSYSIVTVSESGTLWGVFVDRDSEGSRYFCSFRDGVLTEGW